jgi:hypothetical protein
MAVLEAEELIVDSPGNSPNTGGPLSREMTLLLTMRIPRKTAMLHRI